MKHISTITRSHSFVLALTLLLALNSSTIALCQAEQLKGLCGEALATRIAEVYAPGKDATASVLPQWLGGGVATTLIPDNWTDNGPISDAYNLLGASPLFIASRKDYVPGRVHTVTAEGDGWQAGIGLVGDTDINAWWPDADRRGDLARRYMYLAVMYPQELWHGQAPTLMADGTWPLFTLYGQKLMLEWHKADPVDEREIEEATATGERQLNSNPFVEMPNLADHIWGDKSTEGFIPPQPVERRPLKSRYSRSTDVSIDLYSQYVPDNALWSIDGKDIDGDTLPLKGLENGKHILTFTAGVLRGKVKIEISD